MEGLIPKEDWQELDKRVTEIADEIAALAKYEAEDGPVLTPELAREHHARMDAPLKPIFSFEKTSKRLWDFMEHDFLGEILYSTTPLMHAKNSAIERSENIERVKIIEILKFMRKDIWLALRGVQGLKFWVEGESLEPARVSLNEFFEAAKPSLILHNGKILNIEFDIEEGLSAEMHEGTFTMLLKNMCKNAVDRGWADHIKIRAYSAGENVIVEVTDDGRGIRSAIVDNIFKLGYSGQGSTGLGLANAKERLAVSGGSIECFQNSGSQGRHPTKGAKFVMKFLKK